MKFYFTFGISESVNALNRASSISTGMQSCKDANEYCVNALNRASSISTYRFESIFVGFLECVNALNRASSISTKSSFLWIVKMKYVSMP